MGYQDKLLALGDVAEKAVLAVYARFESGELSHDEAVAAIAAVVAKSNSRAAALAALSLASSLMEQLGAPVEVQPVMRPAKELGRLQRAAATTLAVAARSDAPAAIVARLARAEAYESAARAFSEGIAKDKRVEGWVREVEPDGCELCTWWWREGRVWPADHQMPTHKGCRCAPNPVVRDDIKPVSSRRSF
ncbi:hypothetical protein [Nocardia sp. NPDC127526]|uniref:VG15 protein n=1 Tax=Nocardia sp. NPDC127526 TaxID=3345393 RepID=UPI003628C472